MGRVRDSDGREDPLGVYVQWELACLLDVENWDMVYTPKRWESPVNLALQEYCIFLDSLDFLLPRHHEYKYEARI